MLWIPFEVLLWTHPKINPTGFSRLPLQDYNEGVRHTVIDLQGEPLFWFITESCGIDRNAIDKRSMKDF